MLILILFKIGITNFFILYNVAFAFVLFSFQGANLLRKFETKLRFVWQISVAENLSPFYRLC